MGDHEIALYHGLASTCSKKVRMCLYEKGLAFESHLLDLQKFEQHRPEYLALNPNGVVPTLVHKGRPIVESSTIIEFLDDEYPDRPLRPTDAYERAQMRLWLKFSDDVAYRAVYAPTWQRLRERAAQGLDPSCLAETLAQAPSEERRERWEKMARGGFSHAELEAAYGQMRTCLGRIEVQLRGSRWLVGEGFSLADVAMLPFIDRMRYLRPELLDGYEYEALRDWLSRCEQRPSFQKAFGFRDDPRAMELPNL